MPEDFAWLAPLIQAGVLGPIVVALAIHARALGRQIQALNDARIADKDVATEALLAMSEEHNKTTSDVARTMTESTAAMNNLREALRDALRGAGE